MFKNKLKINDKNGFTLMETLLTVAIIAILMSIALPLVDSIQKNLRMKKMDDTAKQIYLMTQNRLSELKSDGRLSDLQLDLSDYYYSSHNLKAINARPQDYVNEDENWQGLYYLSKGDNAMTRYILQDSTLTKGLLSTGHYIIEINPDTATVYSVFYSDNNFTYSDVKNLVARTRGFRTEKMLGYYSSEASISNSLLPKLFTPRVEVVNKEDLYLKVSCDGLRYISQTQNYLKMQITVTDESYREGMNDHKWVYEINGGDPNFFVSATGEVTSNILLDSTKEGNDFKTITGSKLTPGDNLNINVKFIYDHNGASISGNCNTTTNSLFDSKTTDGGKVTVDVANVRQLNNLRSSIYSTTSDFTVQQTKPIDFDSSQWDNNATIAILNGKPINYLSEKGFPAIENDRLRGYDGDSNEIRNVSFKPSEKNNTGLFGSLSTASLTNISLADCKADGQNNVALLAGSLNATTLNNCKAYLTSTDSEGKARDDLEERTEKLAVTGTGQNVGGLVGTASGGTIFNESFAAVNVTGNSKVGGFVGNLENSSAAKCYSSGKVAAANYAGGFVSTSTGNTFTNCYSTSNVTAASYAGGFASTLVSSNVTSAKTFGYVKRADGTIDTATSGPFCGVNKNSKITDSQYLKQGKYNADYTATAAFGTATGFENLKPASENSPATAHPYSNELNGSAFPFELLKDSNGDVIEHYGNWPLELTLQTSLVYYEKYKDGTYGFYAKTNLTNNMDSDDGQGSKDWTVDSLKNESCVEDGYALMTIYKLSDIKYKLNDGTEKTLTIADSVDDAKDGKACLITDHKSIVFEKGDLSYTMANARVYQLPYDLQMTKRYSATRFYDRLTLSAWVGSYKAVDGYIFYYCPDFAKNAINPDPSSLSSSQNYPADPSGEGEPVYIRSPRQLNALGYAPYYWNPSNGSKSFYFKQETDLVYSEYARSSGKPLYCGKTYDLMDTSLNNPYKNRPIGQPKNQIFATPDGYATNKSGNFRQTYDGMGHKIVDYCLETYTTKLSGTNSTDTYQFTGLFGEAESAKIQNVVMTVSNPNEGNLNVRSSGYIISHTDDGSHHMGVGALIGLSYVEVNGKNDTSRTTIQNCSVSGYDVGYEGTASTFAVGGLVGYNFGTIQNSSAVLRKMTFTDKNGNFTQNTKYVGGIVGSLNGNGTISRSYCGANIKADNYSKSNYGMIAGGYDDIYGFGGSSSDKQNYNKRVNTIELCYSFAKWTGTATTSWWQTTKTELYACVDEDGFNTINVKQCFYVTDTIDSKTVDIEDNGTWWSDDEGVEGITANNLKLYTQNAVDFNKGTYKKLWSNKIVVSSFTKTNEANSFPWNSTQKGAYPYPVFVRKVDANGNYTDYIHYGTFGY